MSRTNSTDPGVEILDFAYDFPQTIKGLAEHDGGKHDQQNVFALPEEREKYFRYKYVIERWLGAVLLVLASPATLVLITLVKLTSPGPGLYRQKRVGLNGEAFEIIKLRSMIVDAEKSGEAVWCAKNDGRITRLGKILRTLHLDELPQLWNVACGDMVLVGPRPERPKICQRLAGEIEDYFQRTVVKPGVTGLAQINLPPDETIDDVRRKQILDLHYVKEANPWLDIRMLLATAFRMVGIKGETVMKLLHLCRRDLIPETIAVRPADTERDWEVDPGDIDVLETADLPADAMVRRPR